MKLSQNGFTIMELLIAVGMASFLAAAVMTQNAAKISQEMYYVTRSNLIQDALLASDYFMLLIQQIGGGAIRPGMSIWDENNCGPRGPLPGCSGSDRMTLSTSLSPLQQCALASPAQAAPGVIQVAAPSGVCCLSGGGNYLNKQLMFTNVNYYSQVYATAVDLAACQVTYVPGQASANDMVGPNVWDGGAVTVVNVATIYWDSTTNQINQWVDLNNNGAMDAGEVMPLMASVYDLQIALGYDLDGTNNLVDNGSNSDSWLYNAAGEAMGAGVFATTQPSQLRMVEIGVVLGMQAKYSTQTPATARLLDGPLRQVANVDLRSTIFKVTPRNAYLFQ